MAMQGDGGGVATSRLGDHQPGRLPRICVVVPVLNGGDTIGACVGSLVAQRYPRELYEVIVVDNGSTDATRERVAAYPVRLLDCQRPGAAAARNTGVAATDADIVAFTDADCVASESWLAGLAVAFDDPSVAGAGGPIESYQHAARGIVERFGDDCRPLVNFQAGAAEYLPRLYGANVAYRRQVLLSVGGWDENMMAAEDVELSWRLQCTTGLRLAFCQDALIFHRHRGTLRSLARQFWFYGLGEAWLDTLFGKQPGYPRGVPFYSMRLPAQAGAIVRCLAWGGKRLWFGLRGRAGAYELAEPWLWMMIETCNVAGKLQGLILSRGLRDSGAVQGYVSSVGRREHLRRGRIGQARRLMQ